MYSLMRRCAGFVAMVALLGCEEGAIQEDVGGVDFADGTDILRDTESLGDAVVSDLFVDENPKIPENPAAVDTRLLDVEDIPPDVLAIINEDMAVRPRAVVGKNDRKAVADTKQFPFSAVAKLHIWWSDDENDCGMCSGALIAPDAVLTAAHCVYSTTLGSGSAYKIHAVPGQYQDGRFREEPFGIGSGKKLYYPWQYVRMEDNWYHSIPYDYAVIRLKSPFDTDATGMLPYGIMADPMNARAKLTAYHKDIDAGRKMMTSQDKVRRVFDNGTFNHYCDLEGGASGGPITGTGDWQNKIFAIESSDKELSSGDKYNIATLITEETYDNIHEWATLVFQP